MQDPVLRDMLLEERRRRSRSSLLTWCQTALEPVGQRPARHHELLIRELEAVARGDTDRLMILAPPGSAKSTYSTVLFVPWWFCRHPNTAVISASHTSSLAASFGRRVRNTVMSWVPELGYDLSEDSRAADKWTTSRGGEYITVGVGQAIAGRRADLVVIDDPVRGREAAESQVDRQKVWDWYTGDVYGRMKPGCRIVLIMTRWHEDDLGGRLLQDMSSGGDQWRVVSLPALCEDPESDLLGRKEGEALWPEWEDAAQLLRKRRVSGEREWISQYQQRPAPADGILFRVDALQVVAQPPRRVESMVRAWDLAATEQTGGRNPDWTVGVLMGRMEGGGFVVLDVVRFRGSPRLVVERVEETARADGFDVPLAMNQDPGQAGKAQAQWMTARLAGWVVRWRPETGSKNTRAMPLAAQVEAENVWVLDRAWTHEYVRELAVFPFGTKDDQVDASSRAFSEVAAGSSAQSIIDYYASQLQQVGSDEPARRPSIEAGPRQLVDVYNRTVDELRDPDAGKCAGCGRPLLPGASRCEDGVKTWHQECLPR
jgi:predicted phage terminase large subunit-like protein